VIEVGKISLLVAVAGSLAGSVSTLSLWGATMVARLRRCQSFAWLSAMAAVMNLLLVVVKGRYEVSFSLPGSHHSIQLLLANPTTAFLLLLICGVGAVVESFSLRYLQGDADAPVFFARTGVVLCAMAVVVTASLLITVTLAWVVVGWMFPRVVRYRRDSQAMVKSSQALRRSFIIGDLALVFATASASAVASAKGDS